MENPRPPRAFSGFRLFSYVTDRVEHDRLLSMVVAVLLTLGAVASLLTGVAVWPVVLKPDMPRTALTPVFDAAKTAGIVMLAASAVISFVIMLFKRSDYRFLSAVCTNLLIDIVIAFVFTMSHMELLETLNLRSTMGTILWFFVALLFSYALAIVPAIGVAALIKLLHVILDALLPREAIK